MIIIFYLNMSRNLSLSWALPVINLKGLLAIGLMTYEEGVSSSFKTSPVKTIRPRVCFVVQSENLILNQDKYENKKGKMILNESKPKLTLNLLLKKQDQPCTPWFYHFCAYVHKRPPPLMRQKWFPCRKYASI